MTSSWVKRLRPVDPQLGVVEGNEAVADLDAAGSLDQWSARAVDHRDGREGDRRPGDAAPVDRVERQRADDAGVAGIADVDVAEARRRGRERSGRRDGVDDLRGSVVPDRQRQRRRQHRRRRPHRLDQGVVALPALVHQDVVENDGRVAVTDRGEQLGLHLHAATASANGAD